MDKIIYPHNLDFSNLLCCDICKEEVGHLSKKFNLPQDKYIGWNSCGKDKCNTLVEKNIELCTIKGDELKDIFGETVNVLRSSGSLQPFWKIVGVAYKIEGNDDYWIHVKSQNGRYSKCVTMKNLILWNKCIETSDI